jgi:hypothetical protein
VPSTVPGAQGHSGVMKEERAVATHVHMGGGTALLLVANLSSSDSKETSPLVCSWAVPFPVWKGYPSSATTSAGARGAEVFREMQDARDAMGSVGGRERTGMKAGLQGRAWYA